MQKLFLFLLLVLTGLGLGAQVSITTDSSEPDASAMLDIKSTDKGLLVPRLTAEQRDAIAAPADGLLVYVTTDSSFYFFRGNAWTRTGGEGWSLHGNAGTSDSTDFIGTTDNVPLSFRVNDSVALRLEFAHQPGSAYINSPNIIGGDARNSVSGFGNTISGGGSSSAWGSNQISGVFGTIGGGSANTVFGGFSTVSGGIGNVAGDSEEEGYATISGGGANKALADYATIPGGYGNQALGTYSFAAGRLAKIAAEHGGSFLFADGIGKDFNSTAANEFAVRATGGVRFVTGADIHGPIHTLSIGNTEATSDASFIGTPNDIPLELHVNNTRALRLEYAVNSSYNIPAPNFITGSPYNWVSQGVYGGTVVGGGGPGTENSSNQVTDNFGTTVGGYYLKATAFGATVVGGATNSAEGVLSIAGGGQFNHATGELSTVLGGEGNNATGRYSAIVGGNDNEASGVSSLAAGYHAQAINHGSFVFADYNSHDFSSTGINQFAVRATGGVRFVTAIDGTGTPTQTVSIDNSGTVTAAAFVGDGSALTGIDHQSLSLSGTQLSIENGNSVNLSGLSDNLGSHIAGQNIRLNGYYLSGDGGNEGVFVDNSGNVGIGKNAPGTKLDVNGTVQATAFAGDGSALTGIDDQTLSLSGNSLSIEGGNSVSLSGLGNDNLGDHTATQTLRLDGHYLSGDGDSEGVYIDADGRVGIGKTTPSEALEVAGNTQLSADDPEILFFDDTGTNGTRQSAIRTTLSSSLGNDGPQEQSMGFHISNGSNTGMTQVMTLVGNGRTGIGTAAPSNELSVSGNADFTGNVGIGTSAPTAKLDIAEEVNNGALVKLYNSGTNAAQVLNITSNSTGTADVVNIQNSAFVVQGNGRVGFGTNAPSKAKVEISGSANHTLSYGYLNSTGATGTSSGMNSYSLYGSDRIAASEFNAHSDARIKNVLGRSDSKVDLQTLQAIEITDYTLIDTVAKGSKPYKKVIAQQVREVFPQAVSTLTDVVPDIYRSARVEDGWVELVTDLKPGEKVKLISDNQIGIYEVLDRHADAFRVDLQQNGKVFVYGREVHDFHTVDYEAIAMLNVSATQEQQRIIEAQSKRIAELEAQLNRLERGFARMEAALQTHPANDHPGEPVKK